MLLLLLLLVLLVFLLLRPREWWWWFTVFVAGSTPPPYTEKLLVVIAVVIEVLSCSGLEGKGDLYFSVAGCLWKISLPPLFGYLLVLFLSFLSFLKRALFLHTFPDAHSHSHLHTNNIIMSSAVSSYLVLVSLYLFFFLLSHSLFLSLECVVGVL